MSLRSTHLSLFFPHATKYMPQARVWEAVHARYHRVILFWCGQRGLSHACAEDLAQEIWLKLIRELQRYDPAKGRFRGWLKTVVNNALADF